MPKGTLVIRAAELLGIEIPRFCDHPLLDPAGACRQCIVEVEGQRKPMASCTITCTDGMVVKTQLTSPVAEKAQRGVMELLLINHPLDCPVCDKGGECPLQNQAMSHGEADSRFEGKKRTYEKPVPISTQVLLDRERCVLCARCTRFSNQIAGDPMIELLERGALQQVGTGEGDPFESYFSGNTIQICPVGALTSAAYRFRSRPFDLVSSPSRVRALRGRLRDPHRPPARQGHAAARRRTTPRSTRSGSATRAASAFRYAQQPRPAHHPAGAQRRTVNWSRRAGPRRWRPRPRGLAAARGRAGVLTGGRLTVEDAYAYAKFARVALDTNDIDFRARVAQRRGGRLPGRPRRRAAAVDLDGDGRHLHRAGEGARRAAGRASRPRRRRPASSCGCARRSASTASAPSRSPPHATRGLDEGGRHAAARRARHRDRVAGRARRAASAWTGDGGTAAAEALRAEGAVILVGERLAAVPGGADRRRAARHRDRRPAGVDPAPGGRARRGRGGRAARRCCPAAARPPTRGPATRSPRCGAWPTLPHRCGRDTGQIVEAAASGELGALVVGGVEVADLPDPARARAALDAVGLPGQPGAAARRGHRAGGRGPAGRRGRREGRHLPQLGGPGAARSRPRSSPTR